MLGCDSNEQRQATRMRATRVRGPGTNTYMSEFSRANFPRELSRSGLSWQKGYTHV